MHDCNFKVRVKAGDYCSLSCVTEGVLLCGTTRKRCDGEDNCVIFQIYDRLAKTDMSECITTII